MGFAIAKALYKNYEVKVIHPSQKNKELLNKLKIDWIDYQNEIRTDFLILAIKPQIFETVVKNLIIKNSLVISIAAGVKIKKIKSLINSGVNVVRAMPNLAALIKKSTTAICRCDSTTKEEFLEAKKIFNKIGKTIEIEEEKIDTATALSGSSPAYVFLMISAMVDFGLKNGLNYKKSLELAAYSLKGSLKLLLKEKDKTAKDLTKMVCSPNGTTIQAVDYFKKNNFEKIIINAMEKCQNRAKELNLK